MFRIESLLSARMFVSPQVVGTRLYFLSNLSGHLSLYAMDYGGSVPEPLIPPHIALQNPHLIDGNSFYVFPSLGKILLMVDKDGDENYQPSFVPIEGGYPEPIFRERLGNCRVHLGECDPENNVAFFAAEPRDSDVQVSFRAHLGSGELVQLGASVYGCYPSAHTPDYSRVILTDGYTQGDVVLYEGVAGKEGRRLVFGDPMEERVTGQVVKLSGINSVHYLDNPAELLVNCAIFSDSFGPALLDTGSKRDPVEVKITGLKHSGAGELEEIVHLRDHRFILVYNIDGCTWMYEASFDRAALVLQVDTVVLGASEPLTKGMVFSYSYDKTGDRYAVSYSTAISPTQIYTIEGQARGKVVLHTREKVLGIEPEFLSPGEDASFVSFDGTRISARLYLPSARLGYHGKRPVVYYIHGGPQGQERPDFAWFSMPLIQYLTLNGFAVFVPNVRGSTGYGLSYTKQVDRDWGGKDRLDHVLALTVLAKDERVDVSRAGVVGRSYGGYMTLTLAGRHPALWSAAVDMFGPFDLLTFSDRIPITWKPYFKIALGDPETEKDFLLERSPKTYIGEIGCPLLVIQGKNDPRVVEKESHDLVDHLRSLGKTVDYLVFENEGHDVLKYDNRVRCYESIKGFFETHLHP